jgi:hypothetical protein
MGLLNNATGGVLSLNDEPNSSSTLTINICGHGLHNVFTVSEEEEEDNNSSRTIN